MTHKLPPNLLALFSPRPPLRFLPASDHAAEDRKTSAISGVAHFLPFLEEYKDTVTASSGESWFEKKERLKAEKRERQAKLLTESADRSMSPHCRSSMVIGLQTIQPDKHICNRT